MNKDIYPLAVTVCADVLANLNSFKLSQMIWELTHKLDAVINIDGNNDVSNMLLDGIDENCNKMKSALLTSIMANVGDVEIEHIEKLIYSDDGYHELIDILIGYFLKTKANDKGE